MKRNIRVLMFIVLGVAIWVVLQDVLTVEYHVEGTAGTDFNLSNIVDEYQNLPSNTIQVLFCGTSQVYSDISPLQLYIDKEITAFNIASPAQPFECIYYWLKELRKKQDIKVVFVDITSLYMEREDARWLENIFAMPISINKIEMIKCYLDSYPYISKKEYFEKLVGVLFPLYSFHGRWDEIRMLDFKVGFAREFKKGYWPDPQTVPSDIDINILNAIAQIMKNDEVITWNYSEGRENYLVEHNDPIYITPSINERKHEYIELLKRYCDDKDIELVFVKYPNCVNPVEGLAWTQELYLNIKTELNAIGIEYLDCIYDIDCGIDLKTDTADRGRHLNEYGAYKVTKCIGDYLEENFNLEHISNNTYDEDSASYKKLRSVIEIESQNDFSLYFQTITKSDEPLTIIMTSCEDMTGIWSDEADVLRGVLGTKDFLSQMVFGDTFVAICRYDPANNSFETKYVEISNREIIYEGELDGKEVMISSRGAYEYGNCKVIIDEIEYALLARGLSIVVYDEDSKTVIDSCNFDFGGSDLHSARRNHSKIWNYMRTYERYLAGL